MEVDVISIPRLIDKVLYWIQNKSSRYICVSNVHMCMETFDDDNYRSLVNKADFVVPDGKPLFWAQRMLGAKEGTQVRGFDLTMALCAFAEKHGFRVGLYGGGSDQILNSMEKNLLNNFPQLKITFKESPPFRPVSFVEDERSVNRIIASEVDILFVGLGCPKQEVWMAEHRGKIHCIMVGVGAVFDFLSGEKKQAPVLIRLIGFEWLHRLASEPGRLWRRYLKHNPRFIYFFFIQLLGKKYD